MTDTTSEKSALPDTTVSGQGNASASPATLSVPAYTEPNEHVPDVDPDYLFDRATTLAILAGFARNRRVMVTAITARANRRISSRSPPGSNWPCIRVNLDSHISRIDLIGKDAIVIKDGKQVTEFRDGILPWALPAQCRAGASTNTTPAVPT